MTPAPTPSRPGGASLTIERVYKAPPELVFRAWTDPALTCRWMAPGSKTCSIPLYEVRKGGRFRVEMSGPDPDGVSRTYVSEGTFEEVTPPRRLVMTWQLVAPLPPGAAPDPPTLVTLTFEAIPGGTRMRLLHERLLHDAYVEGARMGWSSAFDKLAGVLRG